MNDTIAGTIRKVEPRDLAAVTRLAAQLGYLSSEAEIATRLEGLLTDASHAIIVADSPASGVIGWIHAHVRKSLAVGPYVEIAALVVDDGHRNGGIGERLLVAAEAWTREWGLKAVWLYSNTQREAAHRFYLRHGYEIVKTGHRFRKNL